MWADNKVRTSGLVSTMITNNYAKPYSYFRSIAIFASEDAPELGDQEPTQHVALKMWDTP
jgi:hypothetical protein